MLDSQHTQDGRRQILILHPDFAAGSARSIWVSDEPVQTGVVGIETRPALVEVTLSHHFGAVIAHEQDDCIVAQT